MPREEIVRKLSFIMTAVAVVALFASPAPAQAQTCPPGGACLGTGNPSDAALLNQRTVEKPTASGPGIFFVPDPTLTNPNQTYSPAQRVPRDKYGVVGKLPLTVNDLDALVFPGTTTSEKNELLEGLQFFTKVHTPGESPLTDNNGAGPMNNQPFCQGCHQNAQEAVTTPGLLGPLCINGSGCASPATRAGRSTPSNFAVTSLDLKTGGGVAPDKDVNPSFNTGGKTAAFTTFGDFTSNPNLQDLATFNNMPLPTIGFFDPLDGNTHNLTNGTSPRSQPFGGFVQHVRPSVEPPFVNAKGACVPKPLPPMEFDTNLSSTNMNGFHRSVGERGAPPYRGLGLMEAVPSDDLLAYTDQTVENGTSSLGNVATQLQCTGGLCILGRANEIPTTGNFVSGSPGRFGLRANGVELLQFVVGGMQGELSLTNALNTAESNFPTLFPAGESEASEPSACLNARSPTTSPEVFLSTVFSIRALMRNIAPPDFGDALLNVLHSPNPAKALSGDSIEAKVRRGAELFGIDLVAFANRTVGNPMTARGDGRDENAIAADRQLNCVGCHTPIHKTGQSPAATFSPITHPTEVGAENLSYVWAPIFSDLLLHKMPVIEAERLLRVKPGLEPLPRDPLVISRLSDNGGKGGRRFFDTFDLTRNLADDTFTGQKAIADGAEFRTPPLMGLGRIGAPFLHDSRVYLSKDSVNQTPAGTVTTNSAQTNAPLVVRTLDDALLAAIELHDLPAPDDNKTPKTAGAGCPVPPEGTETNIDYGPSPQAAICPAYNTETSKNNRSDSAEVIYRFRQLSADDQQAVIEFLKQL
jgi:CxxC motif-containing protein (DUF1111 family)